MTTVLITGANRGLGLEFTRQYSADGATVLAACRAPSEGLTTVAAGSDGRVRVVALDVADHASVDAAAAALSGTAIDVVINNAGIYGPAKQTADEIDFEGWARALAVNAMAPLKVAQAFKPHLIAGADRKLITITSRMGSIAEAGGGFYAYRSSKAAVNMVMHQIGREWARHGIITAVLHPGWVKTDMGGPGADLEPAVAIASLRKVIAGLTSEQSGAFFNYDGAPLPW